MTQRHVRDLPELNSASSLCGFLPLPHEVNIGTLLDVLVTLGKTIHIPAFDSDRNVYRWASYDRTRPWSEGKFGVAEPVHPDWTSPGSASVILVPGLAFDREGNRLGHGLGYYDQLLNGMSGTKIGLTFSFQLVEAIPREAHDIPVDMVITEEGVQTCAPSGRKDH